jgi:hypothetical protein
MESSSKIALKDVLWWMSIKDACHIFSMIWRFCSRFDFKGFWNPNLTFPSFIVSSQRCFFLVLKILVYSLKLFIWFRGRFNLVLTFLIVNMEIFHLSWKILTNDFIHFYYILYFAFMWYHVFLLNVSFINFMQIISFVCLLPKHILLCQGDNW